MGEQGAMVLRRIARPLLATIFVVEGYDALRRPGGRTDVAEPVIDIVDRDMVQPAAQKVAAGAVAAAEQAADTTADVAETHADSATRAGAQTATDAAEGAADSLRRASIGGIDLDDETYVRINGAVQLGAGVLLAVGRAPRLASAALAATLVPTTMAGHRWWEMEGAERRSQQIHFMKNLGLFGGLILAAVDTEGQPGLAWKARHLRDDAGAVATVAAINAKIAGKAAKADAKAARRLVAANAKVAKANAKVAGKGGKLAVEVAQERATKGWHAAKEHAEAMAADTAPARHDAAHRASEFGHHVMERAAELAPQVRDKAAELAPQAREKVAELAPQAREKVAELAPQAQALGTRMSDTVAAAAR